MYPPQGLEGVPEEGSRGAPDGLRGFVFLDGNPWFRASNHFIGDWGCESEGVPNREVEFRVASLRFALRDVS